MPVVDDLVAHIYGWAVLRESSLHDLDRAHDAGAEAARLGQDDLQRLFPTSGHAISLSTILTLPTYRMELSQGRVGVSGGRIRNSNGLP
jgi:hypothetical protein